MAKNHRSKSADVEPLLIEVVSEQFLSPTKLTVGKHYHSGGVCVERVERSMWFAGAEVADADTAHKVSIALLTELGPSAEFADARNGDSDVSVVTMDPALLGPIVRIIKQHLN